MAQLLVFNCNRELMHFKIENKVITYTDKIFRNGVQCLPKPENFILKIKMSRNKLPAMLEKMFTFTKTELQEYQDAKNDTELAEIIIRDCKNRGLTLSSRQEI